MIAKFKKTSRKRSVWAVLVLVALACITLTDAYSAPPFIFGTPTNLGPIVNKGPAVNSSAGDFSLSISADGLELYFTSERPGGYGGADIYVATRETTDDDWGTPVNVGPTVNTSYNDGDPSLTPDGLTLYIASERPGGEGNMDLYVTTRETTDANWGTPVNLGATVNSSADELAPSISADGRELYFSDWRYDRLRPGGYGYADLWVTKRTTVSAPWGTPVNLGWPVNSSSADKGPSISADGLTLFFGSYRSGDWDLWMTTRETTEGDWGTPVNLGSTVNSLYADDTPAISPDGLSLYFTSKRLGGLDYDLYVATRESVSDPFGQPINLSSLDAGPSISADGLSLFFSSTRPDGFGGIDLWLTTRETTEHDWDTPVNLGPGVNSSSDELTPSFSADGLSLYFGSDRPGGFGEPDLWVATRATTEDDWETPVNLGPTVNSSSWDLSPNISADGLSLYFASYRVGGLGSYDLWVTTRTTVYDPWELPVNLGSTVNSSTNDLAPSISADGLVLFFASKRPGGYGEYDIWMTTRETTSHPWGPPENLGPAVNTSTWDWTPALSADGSTLYLASARPGGFGSGDLWQVEEVVAVQALPDFYADGKVDFKDFAYLAYSWLGVQPSIDIAPPPFGDGIVDSRELAVLGEYWLKEPNLVAHWKLNETEGTIAHDSLGNNHSGWLLGGPLWRPAGGKAAGALELDGIDDYVSTPFVLNPYYDGPFSAFAWIKGGEPDEVIISQIEVWGRRWLCTDPLDGKLMTTLADYVQQLPLQSQFVVTDGIWHHIGLVWDGSRRYLYVDGDEVARDTDALVYELGYSDGGLYFGAGKTLDADNFWTGLIDDVRIYDRALSAEDIAVLAD